MRTRFLVFSMGVWRNRGIW